MSDFIYKTAIELAELIRDKKATSVNIVKEHISQIKKHNDELNAVVMLFEKSALEIAAQCDEEIAQGKSRGPLHGVPMTIKECFWMKGVKSTVNFKLLKDWVAIEDATVVKRLKEAGVIILGKTNVPKNLADWQLIGDIYAEGKNPYNLEHTPGGSSGGSATALATGMTAIELGSDLGGSIRLPANYCGVYGLKTTENTIPSHGEFPIPDGIKSGVFHMAVSGPMARDLNDLELLWNILKGPHKSQRSVAEIKWKNVKNKSLKDYNIGWVDGWPGYEVSKNTKTVIQNFIGELNQYKCNTEKKPPKGNLHERSLSLHIRLFTRFISQNAPWFIKPLIKKELNEGILKGVSKYQKQVKQGFKNNFLDYSETIKERNDIVEEWEEYFENFDLLVCPMSFDSALRRCETGAMIEHSEKKLPYLNYTWPYLACFNASGHPGINIPLGIGHDGLPIGVQIVGPYWSEPDLIQFAKLVATFAGGFVKPKGY